MLFLFNPAGIKGILAGANNLDQVGREEMCVGGGWAGAGGVVLDHNVSAQWRQPISAPHVIGGVGLQGPGWGWGWQGVSLCAKHRVTYQLQFIETRSRHLLSPDRFAFLLLLPSLSRPSVTLSADTRKKVRLITTDRAKRWSNGSHMPCWSCLPFSRSLL